MRSLWTRALIVATGLLVVACGEASRPTPAPALSSSAPSLPTPTRPAYPPLLVTATLLPTVGAVDCSTVEHIPPDSPMMQEIREDLMPAILARVAPDIRTYDPDFEEIWSISRVGEWVLLQSRFTKALEPALFLLRATPSGYRLVALWGGQAESATEIRDDLVSQALDVPRELIACLQPAEWFVTTTVQPTATVTRTAIPSETPIPTIVPTLPDLSTLRWQVVREDEGTLRRLAGLTTGVAEAEFSPDGRWLAARLVREYLEAGPLLTALYMIDTADNWHWIAAPGGDSQSHQHAWLPNGQLLWVKEGMLVFGTFDDRVMLDAPERIYEVWPGVNHLALASGETALWRVDLKRDRWERVSELDRLVPKGGSPVSRSSSNLSIAPDGTFGAAILVRGELWRIPLAFGEPAVHLTTIEYPGRGGRINPPVVLAGSPYWIPGEWVFQPNEAPPFKAMLLDSRYGTLVPVEDVLAQAGVEMAPAGLPTASPDGRWLVVRLAKRTKSPDRLYIAPATDLRAGRVVPGTAVLAWQADPAAAIVYEGTMGSVARVLLPDGETFPIPDAVLGVDGFFGARATSEVLFFAEGNRVRAFTPEGARLAEIELPGGISRLYDAQGGRILLSASHLSPGPADLWLWEISHEPSGS